MISKMLKDLTNKEEGGFNYLSPFEITIRLFKTFKIDTGGLGTKYKMPPEVLKMFENNIQREEGVCLQSKQRVDALYLDTFSYIKDNINVTDDEEKSMNDVCDNNNINIGIDLDLSSNKMLIINNFEPKECIKNDIFDLKTPASDQQILKFDSVKEKKLFYDKKDNVLDKKHIINKLKFKYRDCAFTPRESYSSIFSSRKKPKYSVWKNFLENLSEEKFIEVQRSEFCGKELIRFYFK